VKSAKLQCIDGLHADLNDEEWLRTSVRWANMLGCDGKCYIYLSQIMVTNEVFALDPEVAERPQRSAEAMLRPKKSGKVPSSSTKR
jgi:citrate lyase beta subunit